MADQASGTYQVDDAHLLSMVRAGDNVAFDVLYRRHEQAVRRLAANLVSSPAAVDEIVAATFARVLDATRHGGGPTGAFRPYALSALRQVWYDRVRRQRRPVPAPGQPDSREPMSAGAASGPEESLMVRAFLSLPERWGAVLWHTDIEQASAAEVAPLLGLTRNSIAALKRRATEALRQVYLQMYLDSARPECQPAAAKLVDFVRGTLSGRDTNIVASHLDNCADCRTAHSDLTDVHTALRHSVAPVFLGSGTASYLASAAPAGSSSHHGDHALRQPPWVAIGAAVVVAAAAIGGVAFALTGSTAPSHGRHAPPASSGVAENVAQAPSSTATSASPTRKSAARRSHAAPTTAPPASPSAPSTQPFHLTATVGVSGPWGGSGMGLVSFQVAATGRSTTGELTVSITLPSGASMVGIHHGAGWKGWSCQADASGAVCRHAQIPAGQQAQGGITFHLTGSAACGQPVRLTVTSKGVSTSTQSAQTIQCNSGAGGGGNGGGN